MTSQGEDPRLPNFLIVGAMKAGTTSLYHYLRPHPQLFMASIKELDFFVEELNWSRGIEWYRRQFARAGRYPARGEASTNYSKYPRFKGVPERIAKLVPQARLIYVVRDPIERMRSHYQHSFALGVERAPISDALINNPAYLMSSRYGLQVEQYRDHFPPDQVLIVTSEELRDQRAHTMVRVYRFLGIDVGYIAPTLDREYYKTKERTQYSPLIASLRNTLKKRVPYSKRAKELVDSLGQRPKRFTSHRRERRDHSSPAPAPNTIPDTTRTRLEEILAEDVARLRAYMPPGFDGWGIG
ncbi:MAG: sulfotransferase domain-containing protein [Actinomycetota bacterium]